MKFRKFGQITLALLVSLVVGFGLTSCKLDYSSGYLYVTGSQYGQIGAFKIDNDTGYLYTVPGQPYGANGKNPIRALVENSGRFLYVLNQGSSTADASQNLTYTGANIALFSIGGDGTLGFQNQPYTSAGSDSIRMLEFSGKAIYVLDEYEPVTSGGNASPSPSAQFPCYDATANVYRPVGDVTGFLVNASTGLLTPILNTQLQGPNGQPLNYFPVGCFPVDFHAAGATLFIAESGSTANAFHTDDTQTVYPYSINTTTGTLTQTQNAPLTTGAKQIALINGDAAGKYVYIVDAVTNDILAYTPGANGSLQAVAGSPFPNDPTASDPTDLMVSSNGRFVYISNAGAGSGISPPGSEISYFTINPSSGVLAPDSGEPSSTGSGPSCILEDPTNQYVYTSDFNSSTLTGHLLDPNTGVLSVLTKGSTFATVGSPTWCAATGHTD